MPAAESGMVRREKTPKAISSCSQETHSAGVLQVGRQIDAADGEDGDEEGADDGAHEVVEPRPERIGDAVQPAQDGLAGAVFSTARVARKNTSTRTMPVQNQTSVSVRPIGAGDASTI